MWMAILVVLFLGVAAFAIDVAYWHLVQQREQRAADAAALAGAVTWPGNASVSDVAAADIANSNGYAVVAAQPVASGASCPLRTATTNVCGGPARGRISTRSRLRRR